MKKDIIRKKYIMFRHELDRKIALNLSDRISEKLFKTNEYAEAKEIFTYIGVKNEVETYNIVGRALRDKKRVAVPKVHGDTTMEFYYINSLEELQNARFGLLEPSDTATLAAPNDKTLFIVPGVAFDTSGNRIGFGAGYYDTYLKNNKHGIMIGLAYDFQIIEKLPRDDFDVPVHIVITEAKVYSYK